VTTRGHSFLRRDGGRNSSSSVSSCWKQSLSGCTESLGSHYPVKFKVQTPCTGSPRPLPAQDGSFHEDWRTSQRQVRVLWLTRVVSGFPSDFLFTAGETLHLFSASHWYGSPFRAICSTASTAKSPQVTSSQESATFCASATPWEPQEIFGSWCAYLPGVDWRAFSGLSSLESCPSLHLVSWHWVSDSSGAS
jgi:hypothetical protein